MRKLLLIGLIAYGAWQLTKPDKRAYLAEYFNRVSSHMVKYLPLMSDTDISALYDMVRSVQSTGNISDIVTAKLIELSNKYGFPLS